MMQNLPLLNTPNAAPKANAQAASKSNNSIEQANEGDSFQQKLMHQIQQKSAHQPATSQGQQATKIAQKAETTEGKSVTDTETSANDFISRKIKGLIGKTASVANVRQDDGMPMTDKVTQDTVANEAETAEHAVDGTLDPASVNVLAQIQQSITKEASAASGKPASDKLVGEDVDTGMVADDEPSAKREAADNGKLAQTGLDKSVSDKSSLEKLALAANHQRAQSEDFDSVMSESLNKTAAPKETVANIMQNQMMTATQTAAANLANNSMIMAHPGKEGWNQAIGQRVMWMVGAAQQSATLTLNPPEMGPLQIVINVHNDKADTTFFSDRQEVRQALQDGMDNLREMMKEAGINLGQT
ncbi:MAG: flagellar hook-length control protein FliK, partial [Nitrosomonadales bacterium]|nr:flagellar hook-length control protein FliK [Nitrosomonadales bacterium]